MDIYRFSTPLCNVEIAFTQAGVVSIELDAHRPSTTLLRQGFVGQVDHRPSTIDNPASPRLRRAGRPSAIPRFVADLEHRVEEHFSGAAQDFSSVPIDWTEAVPGDFARRVYEALRTVPAGSTVTYGELARKAGVGNGAARAVARAMATNPLPLLVPCHRVVASNGSLCGFSGGSGVKTKAQILAAEGAEVPMPSGSVPLFDSLFEPYAFDLAASWLASRDRLFARLRKDVGPTRLPQEHPGNPFGALVEAVCYQQLAGAAARTIFGKLVVSVGDLVPKAILAAGEARLRSAGLSASKAATILALASDFDSGRLGADELETAPHERLDELLRTVRGIGPWTVQMFSIFHRGLPDVFPPGDLGIRRAVAGLVGKGRKKAPKNGSDLRRGTAPDVLPVDEVESIGVRWMPYRTVATWYLWRSLGTAMIGDQSAD